MMNGSTDRRIEKLLSKDLVLTGQRSGERRSLQVCGDFFVVEKKRYRFLAAVSIAQR